MRPLVEQVTSGLRVSCKWEKNFSKSQLETKQNKENFFSIEKSECNEREHSHLREKKKTNFSHKAPAAPMLPGITSRHSFCISQIFYGRDNWAIAFIFPSIHLC